ncbi:unnamed protein product [Protopolystoma xenopodis]|uniref:Uncharacterized protein n=1 Tax=Protopolystoma xenopodis TaxID=117903 RepID=A0A448WJM7_9PLAT|nr:unnamed protein product [Protopolystoma xenopodis]
MPPRVTGILFNLDVKARVGIYTSFIHRILHSSLGLSLIQRPMLPGWPTRVKASCSEVGTPTQHYGKATRVARCPLPAPEPEVTLPRVFALISPHIGHREIRLEDTSRPSQRQEQVLGWLISTTSRPLDPARKTITSQTQSRSSLCSLWSITVLAKLPQVSFCSHSADKTSVIVRFQDKVCGTSSVGLLSSSCGLLKTFQRGQNAFSNECGRSGRRNTAVYFGYLFAKRKMSTRLNNFRSLVIAAIDDKDNDSMQK